MVRLVGWLIDNTNMLELHEIAAKKGVHVDFKFLEPYNFEFKHRSV